MNHAGEFPDIYLYTAIPGTECGGPGTAQNVFATPEPGSLFLLGAGPRRNHPPEIPLPDTCRGSKATPESFDFGVFNLVYGRTARHHAIHRI